MAERTPTTTEVYDSYAYVLQHEAPFGGDGLHYKFTTPEGYGVCLDDEIIGWGITNPITSEGDRRDALQDRHSIMNLVHVEHKPDATWTSVGATYTLFLPKYLTPEDGVGFLATKAYENLGPDIDPEEAVIQKIESMPDNARQISHVTAPSNDLFIMSLYNHIQSLRQ